jgi:dipeptidyl aminopeptidase/acylaminoacyl peptidase
LLYVQDIGGDENWHIWSVDLESRIIRDITAFQGAQAGLISVDHHHPNTILATINARNPQLHDVYQIDLRTGAAEMIQENPGDIVGWVPDSTQRIRAGHAALPDGGFELRVRESGEGEFKPLVRWSPEDEGQPYGFTPDDKSLYLGNSVGSNTIELRQLDIATGKETVLASNPEVDLSDATAHPTKHHIQAVGFNKHRLEWQALDPDIAGDLEFLQRQGLGEFHISSRTLDDSQWVVLFIRDAAPAAYYIYNRAAKSLEFLFTTRPNLENFTLAEMRPVEIATRDGLMLNSYLTLPPNVDAKSLPMVLNVHGGPWARDTWGYDAEAQWLANRGYACLQVNFRGSTGFGKAFLHAADREWGAKMHDDLLDSVQWAVDQGYADPKRVCIYGGSYGGYAALVGAAFTPDVFSCAVDIVGPSSLATLINSIPPYWEPLKNLSRVRVGDVDTEPEFLASRSPLFKADQIQCPMLIAQGANDPRVKQAESEQIVKALRDRGKEVEYLLFEDEGHGFAKPENRLKFYAAAEAFLAKHLGGRAE